MERKHLVVVGNGMAGMACLDQILQRKPYFQVTVLSEEPHYNYNRILLSSVLAGEKTLDEIYINTKEWYEQNNINLHLNTKAIDVDEFLGQAIGFQNCIRHPLYAPCCGSLWRNLGHLSMAAPVARRKRGLCTPARRHPWESRPPLWPRTARSARRSAPESIRVGATPRRCRCDRGRGAY